MMIMIMMIFATATLVVSGYDGSNEGGVVMIMIRLLH